MNELEDLAKEVVGGNVHAFDTLYEELFPRLRNFVFSRSGKKADTEEIVSESFCSLRERIHTFDETKGTFLSRAFTIAYRKLVSFYRKENHQSFSDPDDVLGGVFLSPDQSVTNQILLEKIYSALEHIPDEQQKVLFMRIRDGLSYDEIARVLGKTPDACKQSYHRAMKLLIRKCGAVVGCILVSLLITSFLLF